MARKKATRKTATKAATKSSKANPFQAQSSELAGKEREAQVHKYGEGAVCDTEKRGFPTPENRSPLDLLIHESEGFIVLWEKDSTLRWRFRESSMNYFANPTAAKIEIRNLFGESLLAWGDSKPVKFSEKTDAWDFEIVMRSADQCDPNGCVLASAFFPDSGRHQLTLFPKMFTQSRQEQVETFCHEIGHVFGLRHFFAQIDEAGWPSHLFGAHTPFTIMNYGPNSRLTDADKADLKRLYTTAWNGELTNINGTPIRFAKPYHTMLGIPDSMVPVGAGQIPATFEPRSRAAYYGRY